MKLTIETAANGWLIRKEPDEIDDRSELHVYSFTDSQYDVEEVKAFAQVLWCLNDLIGPSTSRYSPARIYVKVQPGEKCGDFGELDS